MEKNRFFKFLFYLYLFISVSFLILKIDPLINNIKLVLSYIFNPYFSAESIKKFKFINQNLNSLIDAEIRNKNLENEKREMETKLLELEKCAEENSKLYDIIEAKKLVKYSGKFSSVISINPKKPYSFIYIDKGYSDGIGVYNPVAGFFQGEWIIIGRILETYHDYSKVSLITNSNFSFIADTPKSRGLINGNSSKFLTYKYIEGDINIGDKIFTSQTSMTFPPFIKIGVISDINFNPDSAFTYASVTTFDIKDLNWVYVIDYKPYKEFNPDI